jgi:hypothetical protein
VCEVIGTKGWAEVPRGGSRARQEGPHLLAHRQALFEQGKHRLQLAVLQADESQQTERNRAVEGVFLFMKMGQAQLEFCAFPRDLANWDEASRSPVWRLGCYASSPNGANVWTTSYMPGSNVAMASASWSLQGDRKGSPLLYTSLPSRSVVE